MFGRRFHAEGAAEIMAKTRELAETARRFGAAAAAAPAAELRALEARYPDGAAEIAATYPVGPQTEGPQVDSAPDLDDLVPTDPDDFGFPVIGYPVGELIDRTEAVDPHLALSMSIGDATIGGRNVALSLQADCGAIEFRVMHEGRERRYHMRLAEPVQHALELIAGDIGIECPHGRAGS